MEVLGVESFTVISVQENAFEELFKSHFKRLYAYAITIVKDEIIAEEIVQNVFFKIWDKRGKIEIQSSVTAYLYRAVYNDSLNHLKHEKVRTSYQAHVRWQTKERFDHANYKLQLSELQQRLDVALKELPEQCRTIFQMSRFEELKYQEIAERLGIAVKTVENQVGKALKILRVKLADYLPFLVAILLETFKNNNL